MILMCKVELRVLVPGLTDITLKSHYFQVYRLEEKYKLLKSEINNRVDGEADHR